MILIMSISELKGDKVSVKLWTKLDEVESQALTQLKNIEKNENQTDQTITHCQTKRKRTQIKRSQRKINSWNRVHQGSIIEKKDKGV